jgi:hypothetical protein
MFYGILIRMFYKDHMPPHFHAEYGDEKAVFDFDGNVIEGQLPANKRKLVEAWIVLHREELDSLWKLASGGETIPSMAIEPLK